MLELERLSGGEEKVGDRRIVPELDDALGCMANAWLDMRGGDVNCLVIGCCATTVEALDCTNDDGCMLSLSKRPPGAVTRLGREPVGRESIDLNPKREGLLTEGAVPFGVPKLVGGDGTALASEFSESTARENRLLERVGLVLTDTL